jgi:hypothetical protein
MAPPFDTNLLIRMWHLVTASRVFVYSFLEYVKLAEMVMVQIVGNVKDEHCFSKLAFMKSKLRNRLITHFPLVVQMFAN